MLAVPPTITEAYPFLSLRLESSLFTSYQPPFAVTLRSPPVAILPPQSACVIVASPSVNRVKPAA